MDSQYKSLRKSREDNGLSLRKDAFSKSIIKGRVSSISSMKFNDKAFEIDITKVNIEQELIDSFEKAGINEKVSIAFKEMNSNEINHVMYGVKQIRTYTETFESNFSKNSTNGNSPNSNLLPLEVFDKLYQFLTSKNNENLIYEACCAMVNISCYSPFYCNKLSEGNYLPGIVAMLHHLPEQITIKSQALMIIGNILELQGSSFIPHLLQRISFFDYITSLFGRLISPENEFPVNTIAIVLWNMGSFIKYSSNSDIQSKAAVVLRIYPQLIKLISTNISKEIFTEGLICLQWIIEKLNAYPQIITQLNENNVYPQLNSLISLVKTNLKITNVIVMIYLNLTFASDDSIKLITEDRSLYSSIEKLLQCYIKTDQQNTKKAHEVVLSTYQLLNNLASMGQECSVIIRETQIMEYTMKVIEHQKSNRKLISEIFVLLFNSLDSNDSRIKMELMRFPIFEIAVSQLSLAENGVTDIRANSIKILDIYLVYGEKLIKNKNIIKEQLELLNFPEVLSNLLTQTKNNSEGNMENDIESIYNKYFNHLTHY